MSTHSNPAYRDPVTNKSDVPLHRRITELSEEIQKSSVPFQALISEVGQVIVGQEKLIQRMLVGLLGNGHLLIEGVPGLAKTTAVACLAKAIATDFQRIQFTPDLLPADVVGTLVYRPQQQEFVVQKGPIFSNLILADEINRAPAKVQSALLEAMQERQVTIGSETYPLDDPFLVMATQNPVEQEGTYPLPEAQADRFLFKLRVPFPDQETLVEIAKRTAGFDAPDLKEVLGGDELIEFQKIVARVPVADHVTEYAAHSVLAAHPASESKTAQVGEYVSYGASPRGMQALIRGAKVVCALDGRTAVSIDDVKRVALPALRHRVILNFQGEAESRNIDQLVESVLKAIPETASV